MCSELMAETKQEIKSAEESFMDALEKVLTAFIDMTHSLMLKITSLGRGPLSPQDQILLRAYELFTIEHAQAIS